MSDNESTDATASPSPGTAPPLSSPGWIGLVARYLLPLVIVGAGATVAYHIYRAKPKARQRQPDQIAELVQVRQMRPTTQPVLIRAMGTVVAAREIDLQPQVSGQIIKLSDDFIPGGLVKSGDVIAEIDPADYQVALDRAEAELAGREAELQSAVWEVERLEGLEQRSVANKKELKDTRAARSIAESAVAAAGATVDEARLDRERTTIRAPFNALIATKDVDIGALVSSQTRLGRFVGTDEYWVEVSVPIDRLRWITIPGQSGEKGSPAMVSLSGVSADRASWEGQVLRLLGDLQPEGRMASVLVEIGDPLGLQSGRRWQENLLLGSYVRVGIKGAELNGVFAIPRTALRDGGRVWLMDERETLVPRDVEVAWRDRDVVLIRSGLDNGDQLVLSDIAAPVPGMKLSAQEAEPAALANERSPEGNEVAGK